MGTRVTVDYGSHQYTEPWEKTDLYCLNCGEKDLWVCNDGGDYYHGETHMCLSCEHSFSLPGYPSDPSDLDEQRLRQIRDYEYQSIRHAGYEVLNVGYDAQQNEEAARVGEQQNCGEG